MPHRISMLNIEFNSSCNLRCRWCALDHGKPRTVMTPDIFGLLLSQLAQDALPHLTRIDLHNGGETLLHPNLPAMLNVLQTWKPKLKQDIRICMLTNGMLLTERKSRQLIESGVLDMLRFSIDGGSPQNYENIRHGARWKTLQHNVSRFMQLNAHAAGTIRTEAICLLPEGYSESFASEFEQLLTQFDKVSLRHPHNWDGSANLDINDISYRRIAEERTSECCFLLEHNLVVLPDGSVTVCCNDLNARGLIGSILRENIATIAGSATRVHMRELMLSGRKNDIPLCAPCTGFFKP